MSESFNPQQTNPAAANLTQAPPEFSYADGIREAMADPTLVDFNPRVQGVLIYDRFVGELVAKGGAVSSDGVEMTPHAILNDMDHAGKFAARNPGSWDKVKTIFSRNNGVREAVNLLAGDERTGEHFGHLGTMLAETADGIAFTSTNQIKGYLNALGSQKGIEPPADDWKQLTVYLWKYATQTQTAWIKPNPFSADHDGSLESEWERDDKAKFDVEVKQAIKLGADMELLSRSAPVIRERMVGAQKAARMALLGTPEPYASHTMH